jgi:hypothetical protein
MHLRRLWGAAACAVLFAAGSGVAQPLPPIAQLVPGELLSPDAPSSAPAAPPRPQGPAARQPLLIRAQLTQPPGPPPQPPPPPPAPPSGAAPLAPQPPPVVLLPPTPTEPEEEASDVAPVKPPEPPRPRHAVAIIQALDKVTAETLRFEAPVNQPVRYKDLVFIVHACEDGGAGQGQRGAAAHIEIDSQPRPSAGHEAPPSRELFKGWMFANAPGLHPFEHPVYDAWLIACKAASPSA